MASLTSSTSNVDEVTVDLRNSTITPAESSHVTADLRRPIVDATTTSAVLPADESKATKAEDSHEHECPGHYILNGMVSLVSDDVTKLMSQQKEIKEILDTVMPAVAEKLNKLSIGFRLQFGDKIGMFKCGQVPPAATAPAAADK